MNTVQMDELTKTYQEQLEGKVPVAKTNLVRRDTTSSESPELPINTGDLMSPNLKAPESTCGTPLQLMQETQIKQIMQQYDKDGDEQLNYKEFSDFWDDLSAAQNEIYTPEEKEKIWERYDLNKDGQLDMNELIHIFNPIEHEDRLRSAEKQLTAAQTRVIEAERLLLMVEKDPSLDPRLKGEITKQTLPPAPQSQLPPIPPEN